MNDDVNGSGFILTADNHITRFEIYVFEPAHTLGTMLHFWFYSDKHTSYQAERMIPSKLMSQAAFTAVFNIMCVAKTNLFKENDLHTVHEIDMNVFLNV